MIRWRAIMSVYAAWISRDNSEREAQINTVASVTFRVIQSRRSADVQREFLQVVED